MPEYEFFCQKCGQTFVVPMSVREHDRELALCPSCGKRDSVRKQVGDVTVVTSKKSS
jgi:putative FmdB family regulatory protein